MHHYIHTYSVGVSLMSIMEDHCTAEYSYRVHNLLGMNTMAIAIIIVLSHQITFKPYSHTKQTMNHLILDLYLINIQVSDYVRMDVVDEYIHEKILIL